MDILDRDKVIPRGEDGLHTYSVFYYDHQNRVNWVDIYRARTIQDVRREIPFTISRVKVARATHAVHDWADRMKKTRDEKLAQGRY